jgi:hypothetical protein
MGDFMAIYHGDRKYAKFWVMHEKKIKIWPCSKRIYEPTKKKPVDYYPGSSMLFFWFKFSYIFNINKCTLRSNSHFWDTLKTIEMLIEEKNLSFLEVEWEGYILYCIPGTAPFNSNSGSTVLYWGVW